MFFINLKKKTNNRKALNKIFQIIFTITIANRIDCFSLTAFIRDLFSFYGAGPPIIHKMLNVNFDPDGGKRRSIKYREKYGLHGWKYIERLGLGIDGKQRERLKQQQLNDAKIYALINNST